MRTKVLVGGLLLLVCLAGARGMPVEDQTQFPPTYVPSGEQMYREFCAACHGSDAKGNGPVSYLLKPAAPNLTTLAKRHGGKFPYEYVSSVLQFGPGFAAHGSADMPTWGPLFRHLQRGNEISVQQRIKNLCGYLASLQADK